MKEALHWLLDTLPVPVHAEGEVPQGTAGRYITWQRLSDASPHHLGGVDPQREETFSVQAFGNTEAETAWLGENIRELLDGSSWTAEGEYVEKAVVENMLDDTELPPFGGGERPQFRTVLTVRAWWQPA